MPKEYFERVDLPGFFQPAPHELDFELTSVDQFQRVLDAYVENGEGPKAQPGELMKVLTWDVRLASIGIFDFTSGQQVGLSRAQLIPDPDLHKQGFVMYEPEVFVSSLYERRGLGVLGLSYLRTFLADNVPLGVILRSTIEAGPHNKDAAAGILLATGSRVSRVPMLDGSVVEEWLDVPRPPKNEVSITVMASDVALVAKEPSTRLLLPEGYEKVDDRILFGSNPVARFAERKIELLAPTQVPVKEHWKAVDGVWQAGKLNGYSPRLRFT
jgi:hypothetical protein